MFRVAIVGLGSWGRRLVDSVQGRSDVIRFAAAATRTPSRVEDYCRDKDIRLTGDLAAVLGDPAIEGVVVAAPAHLHAALGLQALEAGKHLMVIKPLAQRRADAEALRDAAAKRQLVLAMGHDRCFLPAVAELRRRHAAGDLGRVVHAEGDFCVDRYFAMRPDDWKIGANRSPPGSLADHMLYTMIGLMGPVEELTAQALHLAAPVDIADTTAVTMRFAGGASGVLTAIGVTPRYERLHVFGTEGWVEIRQGNRFEFMPSKGDGDVIEFPAFDMLKAQLEAFAAAARGKTPYPVSPEDAVAGVAALEAMGLSADRGKQVRIG
jgi:predicted dehydrogenase